MGSLQSRFAISFDASATEYSMKPIFDLP